MNTVIFTSSLALTVMLASCTASENRPAHDAPTALAASTPPAGPSAVENGPAAETPKPQSDAAPPATPPPPPGPDHGSVTGSVVVTPANLGKHVIVYLKDGPKDATKIVNAGVDQRSMQFIPFVTAVASGAKVTFLNNDPFPHNVFSPDGEKFDIGTAPQGQARHRVFEKPGVYTMLCNLHPNMLAYVFVSPSTFFAKVDAQGKFTLAGVPNGTYTVAAWAPRLPEQTQQITVSGADVAVELKLHR